MKNEERWMSGSFEIPEYFEVRLLFCGFVMHPQSSIFSHHNMHGVQIASTCTAMERSKKRWDGPETYVVQTDKNYRLVNET